MNAAPKPTLKVTVDKDTIRKGETVNLLIESTNAIEIHIKGVTYGNVIENISYSVTEKTFEALNGNFTSWPLMGTTQFRITATGIDGSIEVSEPIVVIPTKSDTIARNYWMVSTDSKYFDPSDLGWHYTKWDEDELTRKTYFYKNGFYEVFKKNGDLVGNGYWSLFGLHQDSIRIESDLCKIKLLNDTILVLSKRNETIIKIYKGYPLSVPH